MTMERRNGNISLHKPTENGFKGKPPYSVETPYGFHLDLDFLKYVDDIEKGNTIKRVPIQRRSKGTRASTLPRHLNPSGSGYRPSPWGSTGALGSRLSDGHHYGYTSWFYDQRPPLSPTGLNSLAEMEARIKEFDEQPLGEHIRPHLLRASSLPLTVLLRKGSESTDDPGSLRGSRDHLGGRNTSCEDVFYSSQDCSGLWRRLTEALERVGELEMEVRVIPDLRAQICILQEERERLRLGMNSHIHPPSLNGITHPHTSSCYNPADIKRPRHESHIMFPINHNQDEYNPTHEWRTSTDLDELLTVTSLQAKVAILEQKLHETGLELQRVSELLKEQQEESRTKSDKIEHLMRNPGEWVCAERVVVEQDRDVTVVRSLQPFIHGRTSSDQKSQQLDSVVNSTSAFSGDHRVEAVPEGVDTEVVVHHIKKIKRLLDHQWKCLCAENESGGEGRPVQHLDPKVNALQLEMMGLVDILSSYYAEQKHSNEEAPHEASKSIMNKNGCTGMSKSLHCGVDEGHQTTPSVNLEGESSVNQSIHGNLQQKASCITPREMAAGQVDEDLPRRGTDGEGQMSPDRQMISGGTGSGRTDGRVASVEAETPEKTARMKPQPPGEQMESNSGSETTTTGREAVNQEFVAACQFLKDHMDNMDNPSDDMRNSLIVLFENWFSAAAEETSVTSRVTEHLREVKKAAPALLAFLVNLADDNGNTVLHYSVSHCNYGIVSVLLDTGVSDVNLQNNAGYTPMMLASLTAPDGPGGMEVVRRLMELGNVSIQSSQTGQTALHLAVRHGRVVMVRLLLSCGADANIQDNQGTTALMFAAERGHTHIARLLLERSQCELNLTDKDGRTALSIAKKGSHTDTATLLKAHAKARAL